MDNVLILSRVISRYANVTIPVVLNILAIILIVVLCLWMATGIFFLMQELVAHMHQDWEKTMEQSIGGALLILAMFELVRTLQSYIHLGRVRVTFILDTVLVVLIGELMGLWFKEHSIEKVMLVLIVIATLVVLRIITTRYSPDFSD